MTNSTTPSLTTTNSVLVKALSRMPMISTTPTSSKMSTAGRLNHAPGVVKGSDDRYAGISQWNSTSSNSLRYLVQSAATTPQLIAYSSTRSQPMIQANS